MRILPLALMLLVSSATAADIGPRPQNYKDWARAVIQQTFRDPESVRDVMVTPPYKSEQGWDICIRANGKNGFGGMTGNVFTLFTMVGQSVRSVDGSSNNLVQMICGGIAGQVGLEPL